MVGEMPVVVGDFGGISERVKQSSNRLERSRK